MKKILYIGNNLSKHGNTTTAIETLGAFLEQEGYTIYYSSPKRNQVLRMLDMIFATIKYSRKIDFVMIDTYSTRNFWFAFIISQICRIFNLKYINKLHGGNLPNRLEKNPFLCDLIFKNAFKVIAPSAYLIDAFSERYASNLIYIPNTIDISIYPFQERIVTSPKLLWVRSLSTIYNPKMAIQVLYELKKEFPDASLCMVGPDKENLLQECINFAKELHVDVTFTGKLLKEEWIKLSKECNVFINTTHFDNTPISLIEAMAIGLPLISTNVGGIPFLVKHNVNALLVNDNAVIEMVDAVKVLMNTEELTLELVRNSRKMVEGYDWQIVKHYWFDLFK